MWSGLFRTAYPCRFPAKVPKIGINACEDCIMPSVGKIRAIPGLYRHYITELWRIVYLAIAEV